MDKDPDPDDDEQEGGFPDFARSHGQNISEQKPLDVARPALEQTKDDDAEGHRTGKQQSHDGVGQELGLLFQPEDGGSHGHAHGNEGDCGIDQTQPTADGDTGQSRVGNSVAEEGHAPGGDEHSEQRAERREKQRHEQRPLHPRFSEHDDAGRATHGFRKPASGNRRSSHPPGGPRSRSPR